jgi:hypothetical protein
MNKHEDIPQDIWDEAYRWAEDGGTIYRNIARAILNERNNAAKIAEEVGIPLATRGNMIEMIPVLISQAIRNGGK